MFHVTCNVEPFARVALEIVEFFASVEVADVNRQQSMSGKDQAG